MIYLVEDDGSIRELVLYTLNHSGLEAKGFGTPRDFWRAMEQEAPQLIMLDIMLPEEDGLQILRKIRAGGPWKGIPVMMLTAKGTEYDKVIGLDAGADDYVPKPFGMMELLARVRALLRRSGGPAAPVEVHRRALVRLPGPACGPGERAGRHAYAERIRGFEDAVGEPGRGSHPGPAAESGLGLFLRRGEPDGGRSHPDSPAEADGGRRAD